MIDWYRLSKWLSGYAFFVTPLIEHILIRWKSLPPIMNSNLNSEGSLGCSMTVIWLCYSERISVAFLASIQNSCSVKDHIHIRYEIHFLYFPSSSLEVDSESFLVGIHFFLFVTQFYFWEAVKSTKCHLAIPTNSLLK